MFVWFVCGEHGIFWKKLSFADSCVWKLPFQLLKQERINAGHVINKTLSPLPLSVPKTPAPNSAEVKQ